MQQSDLNASALVPMQQLAQAGALVPYTPPVQTGKLSPNNQKILSSYAGRIYTQHLVPEQLLNQEKSGFWATVSSYMPSAWTVGSNFGWAVSLTHGAQASNYVIGQIAQRVMPMPAAQPATWAESIRRTFLGIEERTIEETARLVLTPRVLPLMTAFCTTGGGLTVMGAVALTSLLYNRIMGSSEKKYSFDSLPDLDQLLRVTDDGKIVDANGAEMTMRDLQDICLTINRYDLTCKLAHAKKEEIEGIMNNYLKGRLTYLNGDEVSRQDAEIIQLAKDRLTSNNPCNYSDEIEKAVNLLADHIPPVSQRIEELRYHMGKVKSGIHAPKPVLTIEELPSAYVPSASVQVVSPSLIQEDHA